MTKALNNAEQLKDIQSGYFVRMMLPDAEKRALPYVREERSTLSRLISLLSNRNMWNATFNK